MKKLVVDLDDTLSYTVAGDYKRASANTAMVETLRRYQTLGFYIVINTSRNMRTFDGNVGKINKYTLPVIVDWLAANNVPYDEIHVGKPWCGYEGFYIDDKAVRPDEFVNLSYEELRALTSKPNDPD